MRKVRPCQFIPWGPSPWGHTVPYNSSLVLFFQEDPRTRMHLSDTRLSIIHISAKNIPIVIKSHQFPKQKVVNAVFQKVYFISLLDILLLVNQVNNDQLVDDDLDVLPRESQPHMRVPMHLAILMFEVNSSYWRMVRHLLSHVLPAVPRNFKGFSRKGVSKLVNSVLKVSKDGNQECSYPAYSF